MKHACCMSDARTRLVGEGLRELRVVGYGTKSVNVDKQHFV